MKKNKLNKLNISTFPEASEQLFVNYYLKADKFLLIWGGNASYLYFGVWS